jgi:hypothetical protein
MARLELIPSFIIQNAQKLSYSNAEFKKFSRCDNPGTGLYGREEEAEGKGVAVVRFLTTKNRRASVSAVS